MVNVNFRVLKNHCDSCKSPEKVPVSASFSTGTGLTRINLFNKESTVFKQHYLIDDFSQVKTTGNCSQKAGNAILGTPDLKISRGACPQTLREEPWCS